MPFLKKRKKLGLLIGLIYNPIVSTCEYSLHLREHGKQTKILLSKSRGRDIHHTTRGKFVEVLVRHQVSWGHLWKLTDDNVQSNFSHIEYHNAISLVSFIWHSRSSNSFQFFSKALFSPSFHCRYMYRWHRMSPCTSVPPPPVMGSSVKNALHFPLHMDKCNPSRTSIKTRPLMKCPVTIYIMSFLPSSCTLCCASLIAPEM